MDQPVGGAAIGGTAALKFAFGVLGDEQVPVHQEDALSGFFHNHMPVTTRLTVPFWPAWRCTM